jgi:hypothetical protein
VEWGLPRQVIPGHRRAMNPEPKNTGLDRKAAVAETSPLGPCSWVPGPAVGRPGMTSKLQIPNSNSNLTFQTGTLPATLTIAPERVMAGAGG